MMVLRLKKIEVPDFWNRHSNDSDQQSTKSCHRQHAEKFARDNSTTRTSDLLVDFVHDILPNLKTTLAPPAILVGSLPDCQAGLMPL